MKPLTKLAIVIYSGFLLNSCSNQPATNAESPEKIKAEIESILKIQEDIYNGSHSAAELKKMAATCEDSMIFIGGEDGGMHVSSAGYINDLADGYTQKPHDRYYRIYDNTVIVSFLQQAYKLFGKDTLYLNVRVTKVFVRKGKEWKMAYTTNAPLAINYTKPQVIHPENFKGYEGQYSVGAPWTDTVTVTDGKVLSAITGSAKDELIPVNDSTFIGEGYVGKAIFGRNAEGKVTHYTFEWPDGQRIRFAKIK